MSVRLVRRCWETVAILFRSGIIITEPRVLVVLALMSLLPTNLWYAMSGTLTPATPTCTIAAGASTCNVSLTWSTANPVGVSAVTSNYPNANTTVFTGCDIVTSYLTPSPFICVLVLFVLSVDDEVVGSEALASGGRDRECDRDSR